MDPFINMSVFRLHAHGIKPVRLYLKKECKDCMWNIEEVENCTAGDTVAMY